MPLIIATTFIVLDYLTGVSKALYLKELDSTLMRKGIFNKFASIFFVLFSYLVDFSLPYINVSIPVGIASIVSTFIIVMEIGSIFENICEINPNLASDKLKDYFKKLKGGE